VKCRLAICGITVDVFGEISKPNCGLPERRQIAAGHRVDETGGRCGRVDNTLIGSSSDQGLFCCGDGSNSVSKQAGETEKPETARVGEGAYQTPIDLRTTSRGSATLLFTSLFTTSTQDAGGLSCLRRAASRKPTPYSWNSPECGAPPVRDPF
jgi:hypothetical protein